MLIGVVLIYIKYMQIKLRTMVLQIL